MEYDVVIVGGGPAGSTTAGFLKKYGPEVKVLVVEREHFPREHVGESQLPPITRVLKELGAWDKCEAAGFPIKTGALYRWGKTPEPWRFDFLVGEEFQNRPRPEKLRGQREQTTFHVERSIYDKILLDHAKELGAEVREGTRVMKVHTDGDRITGLELAGGEMITAKHYVDASGHVGVLRRAMGVRSEEPTQLKNIAIWDYWEDPAWAQTVCHGGVRVRIMSVGYGWIWFIPISETRVSVGLVTHAEYYKQCGMKPAELYAKALAEEPFIASLMANAKSEGKLASTKDWSFLAERAVGENWFLVGESAGFADPILAAGMTLAQVGGRELAHVLLALEAKSHDAKWLRDWYGDIQRKRVGQHIRFADYWYSANAHFVELQAYTAEIAKEAGLSLDPAEGFRWLATGGFISDDLSSPIIGSYQVNSAKKAMSAMTGVPVAPEINRYSELKLNLIGAAEVVVPECRAGRIEAVRCYQRDSKILPIHGIFRLVILALRSERETRRIFQFLQNEVARGGYGEGQSALTSCMDAIEGLLVDGWIVGKDVKGKARLNVVWDEASVRVSNADDPYVTAIHPG